jgi:hypothetical protein
MTFCEKSISCIFAYIEEMETELFSESLLFTYRTTWHYVGPSEISLHFSRIHGTGG